MTNNRRYRLHAKLRRIGFIVNARKRTVYYGYEKYDQASCNSDIQELIHIGYGVQSYIS